MAGMTLDELSAAVERKYEPYDIDMGEAGKLRMLQSLRLPDDKQIELTRVQQEFNALQETKKDVDGKDIEPTAEEQLAMKPKMVELLSQMIRIVSEDKAQAEKFLESVHYDLAHLLVVFEAYADSSQMGEASASPSS